MLTRGNQLQGKVALVTGASAGIGEAIATELANVGMRLVLAARRGDRLEALAARLQAAHPDLEVLVCPTDLRDLQSIERLFAAAHTRFGGIDVLINNAGLGRDAPLLTGDPEQWREMLDVNVLALCTCTKLGVAQMRERGDTGHVVHISSMSAHRVPGGSGVYSATKFAVRSLTEGLRQELRADNSQIRVTAISPGFVRTEFATVFHGGDTERAQARYAELGEVLQASDIAETVVFVLQAPPHMQVHDILLRPTVQVD